MFDSVVLRRSESGEAITAGQLAEALLYYQNVHLVVDRGTFQSLTRQIGISQFLSLLQRQGLNAVHCEESLAAHTENVGAFQVHNFIAFSMRGHEGVGQLKTRTERVRYELQQVGMPGRQASKFAEAFVERVPTRKLSGDQYVAGGIPEAAKKDILSPEFLHKAVRASVAATPGGYAIGNDLKFDVISTDLGFHVFTDIDFDGINRRRAASSPPLEATGVAHVLSHILESRADLAFASFYGGDLKTSSTTSAILQVRHSEILRRASLNADAQKQFTDVVLPDTPRLAEVIDSGERTFDEFLLLLDKAARFKSWLRGAAPDEGLVRTYLRDVSSEGWIQRLPAKTVRYLFALALDSTNPIAGVMAGFVDAFVLEKLLGGWRPSHFVEARLGPFIGSG